MSQKILLHAARALVGSVSSHMTSWKTMCQNTIAPYMYNFAYSGTQRHELDLNLAYLSAVNLSGSCN